jgi:TPR repeat protein
MWRRAEFKNGDRVMALREDKFTIEAAAGEGALQGMLASETLLSLGLMYSTGRSVAPDLIEAHKWFNIAASRGHTEAAALRSEVAREMSRADIADAQRKARDWLSAH